MKKYRIVAFFILAVLVQKEFWAQDKWAPIGAKWHYTAPYNGECLVMESVADTVIKSKNCKIVELRYCKNERLIAREYLHETGDSLQYFNYNHEAFYTLYDFSAEVGDTVSVHSKPFMATQGYYDPYSYTIDSIESFIYQITKIDSVQLGGNWLKRQMVGPLGRPEWGLAKSIVNLVGSNGYFWGRSNKVTVDESSISILRCYKDDNFQYYNPNWNKPCATSTLKLDVKDDGTKIFPNPCQDKLNIVRERQDNALVEFFSINGEFLFKEYIGKDTEFLLSDLMDGVYILKLIQNNSLITYKIIKR